MNERTLVQRIQQGGDDGRAAFEQLLDAYEARVYNLVRRMLPCPHCADVNDVAQEALIEIWKALPGFRFQSSLATWIYRVAMNVTLENLRRTRPQADDELTEGWEDEVPDASRPLDEVLTAIETRSAVEAALAKLPVEQRQVVVLHELNELTYAECAQVLEVPVGTVKSRLFHAMRKLKELLEPYVNV